MSIFHIRLVKENVYPYCFAMQCLVSFLDSQSSSWGRETCFFYYNYFLTPCDCWCSLSIPTSEVVGKRRVTVVLPDHTHLLFTPS